MGDYSAKYKGLFDPLLGAEANTRLILGTAISITGCSCESVAHGYNAADDDDEWTLSHADSSNAETEDSSDHCKCTRLQLQVLQ